MTTSEDLKLIGENTARLLRDVDEQRERDKGHRSVPDVESEVIIAPPFTVEMAAGAMFPEREAKPETKAVDASADKETSDAAVRRAGQALLDEAIAIYLSETGIETDQPSAFFADNGDIVVRDKHGPDGELRYRAVLELVDYPDDAKLRRIAGIVDER